MMTLASISENEVQAWLELILVQEGLNDLTFDVLDTFKKGFGGDIIFLKVEGITSKNVRRKYSLVIKCSKRSIAVREKILMKEVFENEIFVYSTIFPSFKQFQMEKGIDQPFESVAKCYGTFSDETIQVIVFENLAGHGYSLWKKNKPWIRENIEMVVQEYGKFHAISVAMKDQKPELFEKLARCLVNGFGRILETSGLLTVLESIVEEVYYLLKNNLEKRVLEKWINFKMKISYIFTDLIQNIDGLKTIIHGDCWNNNFLLKFSGENNTTASEIALLDWQISNYSSPILDLSYFLFSCISYEDIDSLDAVLNCYYCTFSNRLKELGSDPDQLYPQTQFLRDWQTFGKFGVAISLLLLKVSYLDEDDVPDLAAAAKSGKDVATTFRAEIKNKATFKDRVIGVVKYAVEHKLI